MRFSLPVLAITGTLATTLLATPLTHPAPSTAATADVERPQLPYNAALAAATCGVERWSVKTGSDTDAAVVDLSAPTVTTIASLTALPAPSSLPSDGRVAPTETTLYALSATMTAYKVEDDGDYHLVLNDGAGHTMIAEIPDPSCVDAASPFLPGIVKARQAFDAAFSATSSFQSASAAVTVTGVGFFDFLHGQTGVAPNGIELHPLQSFAVGGSSVPPATAPVVTSISNPAQLAGQAVTVNGGARPGAAVALWAHDATHGGYVQVATATASDTGAFRFARNLAYNTSLFVRSQDGQSAAQTTNVRVKVTIDSVRYQYRDSRGKCIVRFNGGTYPYIPGAPVYIRTTSGTPLGYTRVTQYGASGRYSALFGLSCATTYNLFSLISGKASNGVVYTLNGTGSPVRFSTPSFSAAPAPAPVPTTSAPGNPGDSKNCGDFSTWDQAYAWYKTYYPYYGDVANLDSDNDGIPCESLPGAP